MSGSAAHRGFTLIEMIISMTVGVVIIGAALSFAVSVFRGIEGNKEREEVYRNGRFLGMSLQRDFQTTGVGIQSDASFGTLSTFNDTTVILHVPWEPSFAPLYEIVPPFDPLLTNPLPAGGTCGLTCIDLNKDPDGNFDLEPGDIARLQVNSERRLLLVTGVADRGGTVELTFHPDTTLLRYQSGLAGGLQLDRFSTVVQKLQPIVYFAEDSVLYRAMSFDAQGSLVASPMAYGVYDWQARMIFLDLDELDEADLTDSDYTNEFDDILGVRITALLGTNRPIRVAGGGEFTREYEWRLTPRNLMFERNR